MRNKLFGGWIAVAALLLVAAPTFAHHSFTAEFDGSREFVVKGVLTKVLWANPHIYVFMDVTETSGKVVEYSFESGPPGMMRRTGGVGKADFKVGETVTMTAVPERDGTKNLGWMKMIKYSDGHILMCTIAVPPVTLEDLYSKP
jgi:hypothetical protein